LRYEAPHLRVDREFESLDGAAPLTKYTNRLDAIQNDGTSMRVPNMPRISDSVLRQAANKQDHFCCVIASTGKPALCQALKPPRRA
jgi:hypothetical protein